MFARISVVLLVILAITVLPGPLLSQADDVAGRDPDPKLAEEPAPQRAADLAPPVRIMANLARTTSMKSFWCRSADRSNNGPMN